VPWHGCGHLRRSGRVRGCIPKTGWGAQDQCWENEYKKHSIHCHERCLFLQSPTISHSFIPGRATMRLSALVLGFLPVLSLAAAIDRPGDKPGGNLPDGKPPGPPGGGNGNNTSGNKPGPGPGPGPGHDRDRELDAAASRRIDQMEATYQRNLLNSIKGRKTGCTSDKLLKRREW